MPFGMTKMNESDLPMFYFVPILKVSFADTHEALQFS